MHLFSHIKNFLSWKLTFFPRSPSNLTKWNMIYFISQKFKRLKQLENG